MGQYYDADVERLRRNPFLLLLKFVYNAAKFSIFGALFISLCITTRCNNAMWSVCQALWICDK